jgi:5-methylcytosine-specific restriction endonuclease McrA
MKRIVAKDLVIRWLKDQMGMKFRGGGGYIEVARALGHNPTSKRQAKRAILAFAADKGLIKSDPYYKQRDKHYSPPVVTKISREPPPQENFLESYEWRKLRMQAIKKYGRRCQCCGATPDDGVKMHVDHIKPRKKYPELALELSNLQILCEVCNHGKGNWDETDWRTGEQHQDIVH